MDKPWALAALSRLDGTAERGSDCCGDSDETEHAVCSHVKGNLPHQSPLPQRPAIEIYNGRVNQALAKNIAQNIGTSAGFETWTDWQPLGSDCRRVSMNCSRASPTLCARKVIKMCFPCCFFSLPLRLVTGFCSCCCATVVLTLPLLRFRSNAGRGGGAIHCRDGVERDYWLHDWGGSGVHQSPSRL